MSTADEPLWTAEDVGRLLRRTPRTVRALTRTAGLPFVAVGGSKLFKRAEVLAWIDARSLTLDKPEAAPEPAAPVAGWDGVRRVGKRKAVAG